MTTLNIPIDENVEKEAEELFSDFGLDIPTAVNIFLRQSIRENCIPFNIEREVPNADTIAAMREAEDMKKHPEKYKHDYILRLFRGYAVIVQITFWSESTLREILGAIDKIKKG